MSTTTGGLVHVWAYCDDCEWNAGSRNGFGLAAQHAQRTGHTTRVETGHVYTITGAE